MYKMLLADHLFFVESSRVDAVYFDIYFEFYSYISVDFAIRLHVLFALKICHFHK